MIACDQIRLSVSQASADDAAERQFERSPRVPVAGYIGWWADFVDASLKMGETWFCGDELVPDGTTRWRVWCYGRGEEGLPNGGCTDTIHCSSVFRRRARQRGFFVRHYLSVSFSAAQARSASGLNKTKPLSFR